MKPLRNVTAPRQPPPSQPRERPCPEGMISVLIDVVDLENLMVDDALHQIQKTPEGNEPQNDLHERMTPGCFTAPHSSHNPAPAHIQVKA
jgi:hypothetical protein